MPWWRSTCRACHRTRSSSTPAVSARGAVARARPDTQGVALTRWSLPKLAHHLVEQVHRLVAVGLQVFHDLLARQHLLDLVAQLVDRGGHAGAVVAVQARRADPAPPPAPNTFPPQAPFAMAKS